MGNQTTGGWGRTLLEGIITLISGILIGLGFNFLYSTLGVSFPSVDQFTSQLWVAIQIWTDIATIESPRSYALNTIAIVTVVSAVVNSRNRVSPSPTISGILTSPGVEVWSKGVTKLVDTPFIGTFVYSFGVALRLYLWILSVIFYLVYPVIYILNSDTSLFVATASAILASITFGAVFGRIEKGLVLSIKSVSETLRNENSRNQSMVKRISWGSMIPLSLLFGIYTANLSITSLENPTPGELLSSSTSVFLTSFFAVIGIFYLIAILVDFASVCSRYVSSYQNRDWAIREEIRAQYKTYIEEEISKGETGDDMSGYPDKVADALRDDYRE